MSHDEPSFFNDQRTIFQLSSRFARLQSIKCAVVGKNLYMRFSCTTGDNLRNETKSNTYCGKPGESTLYIDDNTKL
ncbi:hypothetical protein Syun_015227 [Stephania yunnanensis]|uniref:Uncharacterized protein n=1 Tax=Stephania yunnanensis TaxID=152371 RepID=A0AAP0JKX5_9MAGN